MDANYLCTTIIEELVGRTLIEVQQDILDEVIKENCSEYFKNIKRESSEKLLEKINQKLPDSLPRDDKSKSDSESENEYFEELSRMTGLDKEIKDYVSNKSEQFDTSSREKVLGTFEKEKDYQMLYLNSSPESSMETIVVDKSKLCYGDGSTDDPTCYMSNLGLLRDEKIKSIYSMDEDDELRLPRPSDMPFKREELCTNYSKSGGVSSKYITHNEDNKEKLPKFQDRDKRKPISKFYRYISNIGEYLFRKKTADESRPQ